MLPPDDRLWELLLRYLENDLSDEGLRELGQHLVSGQNARDIFQDFCAQHFSLAALFNPKQDQKKSAATPRSQIPAAQEVQ